MRWKVQVKVPASTANLGPGFDTIGMAFQLYTTIRMSVVDEPQVILHGVELEGLPTDTSNLVYKMAELIFQKAQMEMPPLKIEMKSDIPLTRGLGSSAAAIIGGLVAANYLAGNPFTEEDIFLIATELEGHPDNVGASLFGGIVIAVMEEGRVPYIKVDPQPDLRALAVIPDFMLSTEKARGVLPDTYSRKDAVHSLSHASLLAAALATGKYEMLVYAMKDRLHQPYRMGLVPGMNTMLEQAENYGALGTALSGAGPTVISLVQGETAELENFFRDTLSQHGITSRTLSLIPDAAGVQISEDIDTPF
ncbi:homoserine kinase [Ammoniphilus sp. CFH 90114]|uniref:homoserine kinase n=1 Tax=Ammoniphilus sp. CFH 90114 TaxID=2493665 RepID=UPI00100F06D9|nr:homoserine kinase [Ammoniphilus sp. CFH 90114]RXT14737.1 homoserine kinase [Ammoniphilus sp. CFH 90114]